MKVAGIIAEYNPFHNGHKYQIDKIKSAGFDYCIAVMSGQFTERGLPAIADKHTRALKFRVFVSAVGFAVSHTSGISCYRTCGPLRLRWCQADGQP